jgi:hypothetical protein
VFEFIFTQHIIFIFVLIVRRIFPPTDSKRFAEIGSDFKGIVSRDGVSTEAFGV